MRNVRLLEICKTFKDKHLENSENKFLQNSLKSEGNKDKMKNWKILKP